MQALRVTNTHHVHHEYYNIPIACLLNRWPFPAMVLKSNRSGLWRHIIRTCRTLRWLCRQHSNNVARHDKLQSSRHFCRATKIFCRATRVSCRVGVTLCCDFYTLRSCNTCIFSLTTFAETSGSILFWNHKNGITSLVKFCMENTSRMFRHFDAALLRPWIIYEWMGNSLCHKFEIRLLMILIGWAIG